MARMARLVVPGYPHHVTQRGSRRQKTFFTGRDYLKYVELIAEAQEHSDLAIWAYCLMPNHIHMIVVPRRRSSLAQLFSTAHRNYTRYINFREGWRGHLWQERFYSCVMDQPHVMAAVRYVELNPVRAGLCRNAEEWPWSSTRAHIAGSDDRMVVVQPMLDLVSDWRQFLGASENQSEVRELRMHSRTGRPLGSKDFIRKLEGLTGRELQHKKPGPKRTG